MHTLALCLFAIAATAPTDVTIDWSHLPERHTYEIRSRVTETMPVVLHVTNFNFLRYGIEVEVHEKTIESYAYLNKLWQAVFVLAEPVPPRSAVQPAQPDSFISALMEWRASLRTANEAVDRDLARYPNVSLHPEDLAAIAADANALHDQLKTLEEARATVIDQLKRSQDVDRIEYFDKTDATHTAIVGRINAFRNTNELLQKGWEKTISRRDAGRAVTVTLTPKNKVTGEDGNPVTVEYFVNSATPLYYHVGGAYNTVRDIRFEQVRTVAGNDLFEKVRDSSGTASLAAFLSYPLGRRVSSNWTPALTLGTDFSKPGEHLYVGVSIPYQRFVASFGVISASQNQPGNPIVEQLANATSRVLYDAFRSRHVWKPAIALTVKPFDR